MNYETTARFGNGTSAVVAEIIADYRAGKIPETPEHNRDSMKKPAARTATTATNARTTAEASGTAKASPQRANHNKLAAEVLQTINKTARRCDDDISKLQGRIDEITKQIAELTLADKAGNADAIAALKAERDKLRAKVEQLRAIKKDLGKLR